MVLVNKQEAMAIRKRFGDRNIFHTYGKRRHYYMVESPRNLSYLKKYRDDKIIYSSDWK